jgi:hypothetical protein
MLCFRAMKSRLFFALACCIFAASPGTGFQTYAQTPDPAIASLEARHSPDWLKSGTVYQVFVRSFSPAGDMNGVTARLDDLHKLGVNIVWLMPNYPTFRSRNRNLKPSNALEARISEKQVQ